jgi:hypothetical protein
MPTTRLLLVEVLDAHPFRQLDGEALPFVQAWAALHGVPTRLVALGLPPDRTLRPDAAPDLPPEDLAALAAAVHDHAATHALSNVPLPPLAPPHGAPAACAVVPGAAFAAGDPSFALWLRGWLGLAAPAAAPAGTPGAGPAGERLPDLVAPDFAFTPLNPAARAARPPVPVIAGPYTRYLLPLVRSPFFKPDEAPLPSVGCVAGPSPYATPVVELMRRQIEAARRTLPAERQPLELVLHGCDALRHVAALAAHTAASEPAGTTFGAQVSAAAFLAAADEIERALPLLRAAGQRLEAGVFAALNASPAECERIGAGASPAQQQAVEARLRDWEARFPTTFHGIRAGGDSLFLYAPWTTTSDLRMNVETARILGPEVSLFPLTTRACLRAGTPAAARAAADGLLVERSDPAVFGAGADEVGPPHLRGLPWRFADPRVALVHALAVRFAPTEERAAGDVLHLAAQNFRGALDEERREDPVSLFELLLDTVAGAPSDASPRAVLETMLERIGRPGVWLGFGPEPAPESGEPPAPEDDETRAAQRIAAHFAALPEAQRARLQGFAVESAVAEFDLEGHRVVTITLRRDQERIVTNLLPRRAVRGSFATTTQYALCYHRETPIDSRDKELAAQAVAEIVEALTT